jgi:hypothetical protein
MAFLFGFWALIFTIPFHIFYSILKGNKKEIKKQNELLQKQNEILEKKMKE